MGVWSSAFLHQFQDGNPANFNAAPGQLSVLPGGLAVQPTPPPEQRGFAIRPGQVLDYVFDRPFENVVGVDIALDLFFPEGSEAEQLPGQVLLGGGQIRLFMDFLGDVARLQLHPAAPANGLAISANVTARGLVRLQARWHTHGQAEIRVNGTLRGYRPGIAAGASFTIDRLALRHHADFTVPGSPAFLVRRFSVKLLRRDDPLHLLDTLQPIGCPPPVNAGCARQAAAINASAMREIRQFMTAAVVRLTSAWSEGASGAPFSDQAIAAHAAAVAAGDAFVRFMARRQDGDAERVLDHLTAFLQLIAATDPDGYAQLVVRLEAMAGQLDPRCREALEPWAQRQAASLRPFIALLQALWDRIQSPGGSHG